MAALDVEALRAALGSYAAVDVVDSTGSTNADLVAAADSAADRTVLIAEQQTAGRGRRARDWVSPPASGIYLSVLLRPTGVPVARYGSLSLVAGVALIRTARHAGVIASLKWPNDLLAGAGLAKCAGVLAEVSGQAVVLGIGLNVAPLHDDVPVGPGGLPATSLAQEGGTADRTAVAIALLRAFDEAERSWRGAQGDLLTSGLLAEYRASCATLGQRVRVELPDGTSLQALATDIDGDGRLVVDVGGTARTLSAGDVVHVRPGA
ncbi:biotin--[acetyl-CoA-carboxylase] ligase [Actinokineospora diospyrosa]|uniref:biotin--[biotin carboxyl-carrier protein] ligase n=1 Tax=Actinokineospora diospyrosa TaxID=103728 RepID=A0ABT1IIF8_9PSEU|nr:biotin--[acetyl-CoA-carboxylase] ligase [Actinokineospora diospyrosa]MCP2272329.1 BirA family transcriptional regulator, biotin operon repressor / biotin-[acetyl-CoA-carboxylase] ligase [Actinokineospora diospyrosa]